MYLLFNNIFYEVFSKVFCKSDFLQTIKIEKYNSTKKKRRALCFTWSCERFFAINMAYVCERVREKTLRPISRVTRKNRDFIPGGWNSKPFVVTWYIDEYQVPPIYSQRFSKVRLSCKWNIEIIKSRNRSRNATLFTFSTFRHTNTFDSVSFPPSVCNILLGLRAGGADEIDKTVLAGGKKHFSHVYITQTSHRGSYYESRKKGGRTTRQSYSSPDRLRSPNLLREISHYLPLEEAPRRRRRRRRRSRRHAHEFGHGRFRERFSRFTQPTRSRTASARRPQIPLLPGDGVDGYTMLSIRRSPRYCERAGPRSRTLLHRTNARCLPAQSAAPPLTPAAVGLFQTRALSRALLFSRLFFRLHK